MGLVPCLGVGCAAFDAAEGTSVQVAPDGSLLLEDGAVEGELRHVFEGPCAQDGSATYWHSVSLSGSLVGVTLEVRGARTLEELDGATWQPVGSGDPLPALDPSGCGPDLLEVRVLLRAQDGAKPPRVDGLTVCHGCLSIFC